MVFLLIALLCFGISPSVGDFFIFIAVLMAIYTFIKMSSSEFALTNKRVLIKVGVLTHNSLETQLNKVSNISVSQGVLGRLLGYGTIIIASTGGVKEMYPSIENPILFKKKIQEAIEQVQ